MKFEMQEQYLINTELNCAYFFHSIGNALSTSSNHLLVLISMGSNFAQWPYIWKEAVPWCWQGKKRFSMSIHCFVSFSCQTFGFFFLNPFTAIHLTRISSWFVGVVDFPFHGYCYTNAFAAIQSVLYNDMVILNCHKHSIIKRGQICARNNAWDLNKNVLGAFMKEKTAAWDWNRK